MAQIHDMDAHRDKRRLSAPLNDGDGGGTYDDMERRVTRLEDKFDNLSDRIGGVQVELATLTERVAHLPSKGFIVTGLGTAIAILVGLATLARHFGFFTG